MKQLKETVNQVIWQCNKMVLVRKIEGGRLKKQLKGGGFCRRCSAGFQPGCHMPWHILLPPRKCRSFRFFIGLWRRTGSFVFKQAAAWHHVSLCFLLLAELTLSVGLFLANLLSLRCVFDFCIKFKLNYILKVPVLILRNTSEILTATETKHSWTYFSSEVFLTLVESHQVMKMKPYYIQFLSANMKILYQLKYHYPHCQWEPRSHNPWRTLITCDQLITQVQTPDTDKALLAKTHFNFIVTSMVTPSLRVVCSGLKSILKTDDRSSLYLLLLATQGSTRGIWCHLSVKRTVMLLFRY